MLNACDVDVHADAGVDVDAVVDADVDADVACDDVGCAADWSDTCGAAAGAGVDV